MKYFQFNAALMFTILKSIDTWMETNPKAKLKNINIVSENGMYYLTISYLEH